MIAASVPAELYADPVVFIAWTGAALFAGAVIGHGLKYCHSYFVYAPRQILANRLKDTKGELDSANGEIQNLQEELERLRQIKETRPAADLSVVRKHGDWYVKVENTGGPGGKYTGYITVLGGPHCNDSNQSERVYWWNAKCDDPKILSGDHDLMLVGRVTFTKDQKPSVLEVVACKSDDISDGVIGLCRVPIDDDGSHPEIIVRVTVESDPMLWGGSVQKDYRFSPDGLSEVAGDSHGAD